MKEKIYTIPITEAFEKESFCPFCTMHKSLDEEAVTYTVGPAMMEPDFRIITNETGFCQKHMRDLHAKSKALPLSLVIDTHLSEVEKLLCIEPPQKKKTLFKKDTNPKNEFADSLVKLSSSCAVCNRIEHTFSRYFNTFVYMLKKEKGFLEKVLKCEGFCMEHFALMAKAAAENMTDSEFEKLFAPIIQLQKKRVGTYKRHIKSFADSFDYRNAGKKVDAPKDILLKSGYLLNGEFEPKEKDLGDI